MDFKPIGNARDHYWMTIKMADRIGVSLVDAWADGRLSSEAYDGMITRCRHCAEPGACARLLDQVDSLVETPAYCANQRFFKGLAEDG